MIRKLFEQTKPQFISVSNGQFQFKGADYAALEVFIHDIIPVRKRFAGSKLVCFARDGTTAVNGQVCGFCRDLGKCQRRLRLNLMLNNVHAGPLPASLEIRAHLFNALELAVAEAGDNNLHKVLFQLTAEPGPQIKIRFKPIF